MAQQQSSKKHPTVSSPIATFKYPKLNEPDYGTKEYPNPDGSYNVRLVMGADSPEAKELLATLQPHYENARAEADAAFAALPVGTRKKLGSVKMNPLFSEIYDRETEQPTGEIEFKISMKASGVRKKGPKAGTRWHRKPAIYDAHGAYLAKPPAIWGGTKGRVNFEVAPYFINGTGAAGLRLGLNGVQIVDLVSVGARSAESMGFGAVEGGYAHVNEPAPEAQTDADNTELNDGSGDF